MKRYDPTQTLESGLKALGDMEECADGQWVKREDVEALVLALQPFADLWQGPISDEFKNARMTHVELPVKIIQAAKDALENKP